MNYWWTPERPLTLEGLPALSLVPIFRASLEVRKDRAFLIQWQPGNVSAWSIFIDNPVEDEIIKSDELPAFEGTPLEAMAAANARYDDWASPSSEDKATNRLVDRTVLGIRTHGALGRRDSPKQYIADLASATLWILWQPRVEKKWIEVLVGRWVRQLCLRRAGFMCFQRMWSWLAQLPRPGPLPTCIRAEFLAVVCIAPLLYVDLRAEILPEVSATDASQQAAGVCRTTGLTVAGRRFLRDAHTPKSPRSADEVVLLGQVHD